MDEAQGRGEEGKDGSNISNKRRFCYGGVTINVAHEDLQIRVFLVKIPCTTYLFARHQTLYPNYSQNTPAFAPHFITSYGGRSKHRFMPINYTYRFYFLLLIACGPIVLFGQYDLRVDSAFFAVQEQEFQHWLEANEMDQTFRTDGIEVETGHVLLFLTFAGDAARCDSLQAAWDSWERQFNRTHRSRQLFHQKLLETWSVLAELSVDSTEIIIRCDGQGLFNIRIFGQADGRILAQGNELKAMGGGVIPIPFENLKEVYTGNRIDSINRKLSVRKVRVAVGDYLLNEWYKGKGTPILYNVRIDTSASYYNEFTWEFTHLSHEVLEEGYYEYHRIKIEVQERNDQLEMTWEFTGKFGSGILFPPRRNDYKLMETYYKDDMEAYEEKLFRKITEYLQKQQ